MNDYILEEINKAGADGVDFVDMTDAFFRREYHLCKVICSYTKKEWINCTGHRCMPKSPRLYWKMIDGNKVYTD
jgi:hypothetical protein